MGEVEGVERAVAEEVVDVVAIDKDEGCGAFVECFERFFWEEDVSDEGEVSDYFVGGRDGSVWVAWPVRSNL